jgi:hypothetical protein
MRPRSFRDSLGRYRSIASGAPFPVCTWQTRWAYSSRAPVDHSGGTVADFHGLPFALRTARGSLRRPSEAGSKSLSRSQLICPRRVYAARFALSIKAARRAKRWRVRQTPRAQTRFCLDGLAPVQTRMLGIKARSSSEVLVSGKSVLGWSLIAASMLTSGFSFALLRPGPDRPWAKIGSNWG